MYEHDAVVVGAGPNGLVAAVTLASEGWDVLVVEAADEPGGGARSLELTVPGALHDVCSAVHPLGLASPALRDLPLADHGLEWLQPEVPLAHPLDGGRAAVLRRDLDAAAAGLDATGNGATRGDGQAWRRLVGPAVAAGLPLVDALLSPLRLPPRPLVPLARFGLTGVRGAAPTARRWFRNDEARALLAGLSAHSTLSLRAPISAAYGTMLGALAHLVGWPVVRGGSQGITDALVSLLEARGGSVACGTRVADLRELPSSRAVLLDHPPRQVLHVAGDVLPDRYRRALARYRYGPGAHKVDWLLDGPVPWTAEACRRAGTVHVGGTLDEIAAAEEDAQRGRTSERPFVLVAQPSGADPSRAPEGSHVLWGYCHVPHGSTVDMTSRIEAQIERFAPGFRDRIVARHVLGPAALEAHNANDVGGDIAGGATDLRQFVARPVLGLHPWATPVPGLYLCSSSTPPGPGVHGMCGLHAAHEVLRRSGGQPTGRRRTRWSAS